MTPPQVAYWETVLARVVASDEWKQMLERDSLENDFLKSAETRNQLKAEQEELKAIMGELGLIRQ
jgi:tripartite-type tricarboxylate transporter receptor subunit TctC